MESARLAVEHDVHRAAELLVQAADEAGGQRGGNLLLRTVALHPPWLSSLLQALARPDGALAVGFIDDVIVGVGYGRVAGWSTELDPATSAAPVADPVAGDRVGVIDVLYVEPGARGVGVGEAIVGVLMERFDDLGCRGVDAFALPGNRDAKAFFETHGFVTRMLVMHRPARSE
jgi:ribosomal protein S18 acetylase RimI-like enzyme